MSNHEWHMTIQSHWIVQVIFKDIQVVHSVGIRSSEERTHTTI